MLLIKILQEDIVGSIPGNIKHCALARALKRIFPTAFSVRVTKNSDAQSLGDYWHVSVMSMKYSVTFNVPKNVREILENYDRTGEMTPFSFSIPF